MIKPPKGPTTNVICIKCNISSVFKMMTHVAFRCFKYSVEMGNTQRLGGGYSSNFQVDSIRVLFFQKPACLIWQVGPPQPSCERPSILCAFGECKNVVCRLSFATNKKPSGSVGWHLSYLKTPSLFGWNKRIVLPLCFFIRGYKELGKSCSTTRWKYHVVQPADDVQTP